MTLDELLDFCQENGVSITIMVDEPCNAVRVRLQSSDLLRFETLVPQDLCKAAENKDEQFRCVLYHLLSGMNTYRSIHPESRE